MVFSLYLLHLRKQKLKIMKKLFPVAIIAVFAMMFTSCKKDYTCSCTETDGGTVVATVSATFHDTKSKAQTACSSYQSTVSTGGTSITVSCSLK